MSQSMDKTWRFNAFDTWFFRESRPMDSIGGSELASLFPPPATTLAGAVRTAIGEHLRVDWSRFQDDQEYANLRRYMGDRAGLGNMTLAGPWLAQKRGGIWERLYPVPANLLGDLRDQGAIAVHRLKLGPPMRSDLGLGVRLPVVPTRQFTPLANYWITGKTLNQVLNGETPAIEDMIQGKALFEREARLGIARFNPRRTAEEGMLYQTAHIRLAQALACEVDVAGLPANIVPAGGSIRLGGEGRAAHFEVLDAAAAPFAAPNTSDAIGLILYLLTPLAVSDPRSPMPLPGFTPTHDQTLGTRWIGDIGDCRITIHGAVLGPCLREGGWDVASRSPRPVRSLVPPGSLFYVTAEHDDLNAAIEAINATQIGDAQDRALGRGRLIAGVWPRNDNATKTR